MPKMTHIVDEDEGLIALYVDGKFLTECAYEDDPETTITWCEKLFNAGREIPLANERYRLAFWAAIETPSTAFKEEFTSFSAAIEALNTIANYTLYLHKNQLMHDFSNTHSIEQRKNGEWVDLEGMEPINE